MVAGFTFCAAARFCPVGFGSAFWAFLFGGMATVRARVFLVGVL
jgi:hypothetical protein